MTTVLAVRLLHQSHAGPAAEHRLPRDHHAGEFSFRPIAAAAPYVAVVPPAALAAAAAGLLGWSLAVALAVAAVAAGVARGLVERLRLGRARADADRWIRYHPTSPPPSAFVADRIEALVRPRQRLALASSLRGSVETAFRPGVTIVSVLHLPAVREHASLIGRLAERLAELDRSVHPRGVVLTLDLLTDGCSPLYEPRRRADLGPALLTILAALEGRR
jgi:hypothetical protein